MSISSEKALNMLPKELMTAFRDDLFICLLDKLGGKVVLTVDEIDQVPKGMLVTMDVDHQERTFTFTLVDKKK